MNSPPEQRFARFWDDRAFADCTLELHVLGQQEGANAEETILEVPVHRLVLAEASAYFASRLHGAAAGGLDYTGNPQQHRQPQSQLPQQQKDGLANSRSSKRKRGAAGQESKGSTCAAAGNNSSHMVRLVEHCTAEQLPAVQRVLALMYQDSLPAEPTLDFHTLAMMRARADLWQFIRGCQACSKALLDACRAVGKEGPVPIGTLAIMLQDLREEDWQHGDMQALLGRSMTAAFPNGNALLQEDAQLAQFCALPLRAVAKWADDIRVMRVYGPPRQQPDHPNGHAVLAHAWYRQHAAQLEELPQHEQQEQYALLRRMVGNELSLSPSYRVQVAPRLPWLASSTEPYELPAHNPTASLLMMMEEQLMQHGHSSQKWHRRVYNPPIQLQWEGSEQLYAGMLAEHTAQADGDPPLTFPLGPAYYLAGYMWQPWLRFATCSDPDTGEAELCLCVALRVSLPPQLGMDSQGGVSVAATVTTKVRLCGNESAAVMHKLACGSTVEASTFVCLPGLVDLAGPHAAQAAHPHLTLSFSFHSVM